MAVCPHCESPASNFRMKEIILHEGSRRFRGYSYACMSCSKVISVGQDIAKMLEVLHNDLKKR